MNAERARSERSTYFKRVGNVRNEINWLANKSIIGLKRNGNSSRRKRKHVLHTTKSDKVKLDIDSICAKLHQYLSKKSIKS